jgi:endonuclease V-like protein UPF0215 family
VSLGALLGQGRRIRSLGVDDGPFSRGRREQVLVVGAVYIGGEFEGLLSTRVSQDGKNATDRLLQMIGGSKFRPQLHAVMLDGITLGGFNVVDLQRLARELELPCLAVVRGRPDLEAVRRALTHLPRGEQRWRLICAAGPLHRCGALSFQAAGVDPEVARQAIRVSVIHGHMPECLRGAHLIASGIVNGESGRRA